ncbi:hypothetical protein [Marivita sp.]|uniref:hypothetical protein n=1 Tax=Marivita sp. TaxID=2003365 RepID=UPI0025BB1A06|nr:hypothetical protein [Marivita sp.]
MLTIALTSIPPRFGTLAKVTQRLLAQTMPVRVVVSIPRRYRRFPGVVPDPDLPPGVILRRTPEDYGPASKLLGVVEDPEVNDILYCDDDWLYAPTWAEALTTARSGPGMAVAASTFPVSRIKRSAQPRLDRVAQGFAGVLVNRDMFQPDLFHLPDAAFATDDIWLSGYMAARNISVVPAPAARALCAPVPVEGPQLQDSQVGGVSRAGANIACADALTRLFGVWPAADTD